jgi:3-deoxy-D-manno-octulosonate 8-phosphate phosphatase (KDO 8-P phosphatase)
MKGSVKNHDTILAQRLKRIRMLLLDVDGVLTNGGIFLGSGEQEFKQFHVQDGMGITLAQMGGLKIGIITGRVSESVTIRSKELKIDEVCQGVVNKVEAYDELLQRTKLRDEEVCFVGDDLQDMGLLKRVGLSVAVANARSEVKRIVHIVTEYSGGNGAVREIVEIILKAQGRWETVISRI